MSSVSAYKRIIALERALTCAAQELIHASEHADLHVSRRYLEAANRAISIRDMAQID